MRPRDFKPMTLRIHGMAAFEIVDKDSNEEHDSKAY